MKTKPASPQYKAFENLLGKVLTVTKAELNERLKKDEQQKDVPSGKRSTEKPSV
jgi:hypothetical protein